MLICGIECGVSVIDNHIHITSPWNESLIAKIKSNFENRKWNGFTWSFPVNPHNVFRLLVLAKGAAEAYKDYDAPLNLNLGLPSNRKEHQVEITAHIYQRRKTIVAGEMGIGKSLATIDAINLSSASNVLWVAPKSAMYSVILEVKKWGCRVQPTFVTYDGLKKLLKSSWEAPQFLILDESQRIKTPTSGRSLAARTVCEAMWEEYKKECWITCLSGTPAPKSPVDLWHQAHCVHPGYLEEPTQNALKYRLELIKMTDGDGGSYPKHITWFDDENKCKVCGQLQGHIEHQMSHSFIKSVNEIEKLYKRLSGLFIAKFKKDCTDLPDKIYRVVQCETPKSMLTAAKMIPKIASRAVTALTLLRELSDGFQYDKIPTGEKTCPICNGSCRGFSYEFVENDSTVQLEDNQTLVSDFSDSVDFKKGQYIKTEDECEACNGLGTVPNFETVANYIPNSPKEIVLKDLLEEFESRIVIYAGFTASIDLVQTICEKAGWTVIRVDSRGWVSTLGGSPTELINKFQDPNQTKKIAFVGHPMSAGTGITLTASPAIIYYSNDFNYESRGQSEDRIHRLGMDVNKGATIIDIYNLQTDKLVHNNLNLKKRLQSIAIGQVVSSLEETSEVLKVID